MSEYIAEVSWQRNGQEFLGNRFSRAHQWTFDGGASIDASPSPHILPTPMSVEEYVDPEEAFVASLSSCHMLFFLYIAAKREFIVDNYVDKAIGVMEKNEEGKMAMTEVKLRTKVVFSEGYQPTTEQLEEMHHEAHERCFIANSVKTKVVTEVI